MAKQLDTFEYQRPSRSVGSKYDPYFDGNVWEIPLSETGCTTTESLRVVLIQTAARRGLRLRTRSTTDSVVIQVADV